ncbi:MAG: hypothetical protein AB8B50_08920 [Pirellulaceae bacterium]
MGLPEKKKLFRILAILLGILPFFVIEAGLRIAGLPQSSAADPFVDLSNVEPLFVPSAGDGEQLEIAANRMHLFRPAAFKRSKPAGTLRVFALGGSTTQGEPYSTETAFPHWAGICLEAAMDRDVEVINCGGLSYASYRVLAILREVIEYEPDLILIYTGHNEYLEHRSFEGFDPDSWRTRSTGFLSRLRTVALVRQLWAGDSSRPEPLVRNPTRLTREVDALLDYRGGLDEYQRGSQPDAAIVTQFEWNLRQMVGVCRARGVPVHLVSPVSNIRDCPPFKIEPSPELEGSELDAFQSKWLTAKKSSDSGQAKSTSMEVLRRDAEHAGANFILGRLLCEQGNPAEAAEYLWRALDGDVCKLRATRELVNVVHQLAEELQVPCLRAQELFEARSRDGLVGDQWLVDHIHPSVEGHQAIGEELALQFLTEHSGWVNNEDWSQSTQRRFAEYLGSLNASYFARGQQRLEGLRLWTEGRAKKLREGSGEGGATGSD